MKNDLELYRLILSGAPDRLQAIVAIGKNASRRGLCAHELERFFNVMVPGRAVARESNGRPIVRGSGHHMSLSHAKGLTVLALAPFAVGIDVEYVDPDFDPLEFAPEFFGKQDFRALEALQGSARRDHFLLVVDNERGEPEAARTKFLVRPATRCVWCSQHGHGVD